MIALVSTIARGTAVVGAVFLVVALLKRLILAVGVLIAVVKLAVIIIFLAVLTMIAIAIYHDRQRRKTGS